VMACCRGYIFVSQDMIILPVRRLEGESKSVMQ
jgi:hypothetical protein